MKWGWKWWTWLLLKPVLACQFSFKIFLYLSACISLAAPMWMSSVYTSICVSMCVFVFWEEGERTREWGCLEEFCWFPAYLMSRQNLLSKNCLPVLLRGRTSFPQRGILSDSLPLLSDLSIRIPQLSSQIPWCGLSTERRGRESQPLITEWSPAVRSRVSFTKNPNC